jgi:hypothetical protein
MNDRLDPARVFGQVVTGQLERVADDYERISTRIREVAARVPDIGTRQGVQRRDSTAVDLVGEVLRIVAADTPTLAALLSAAADYDRHVPTDR